MIVFSLELIKKISITIVQCPHCKLYMTWFAVIDLTQEGIVQGKEKRQSQITLIQNKPLPTAE